MRNFTLALGTHDTGLLWDPNSALALPILPALQRGEVS
jgi:hypothetical protein